MWKGCSAVSLSLVVRDLNTKTGVKEGDYFFCSLNPHDLQRRHKVFYFVSEYEFKTKYRPKPQFLFSASQWTIDHADIPDKDRIEVVPHEVPQRTYRAKYHVDQPATIFSKRKRIPYNKEDRDIILFISDAQVRKNPHAWGDIAKLIHHKIVAVVPTDHFKDFPESQNMSTFKFGSLSDDDLIRLMQKARLTLIMSGGEGFGLPALEGAFAYAPPVGVYYDVLSEIFPDKYVTNNFIKFPERQAPSFIPNAKYVYRHVTDPKAVAEIVNQRFNDITKEDAETLSDYIETHYGTMTQYRRFIYI